MLAILPLSLDLYSRGQNKRPTGLNGTSSFRSWFPSESGGGCPGLGLFFSAVASFASDGKGMRIEVVHARYGCQCQFRKQRKARGKQMEQHKEAQVKRDERPHIVDRPLSPAAIQAKIQDLASQDACHDGPTHVQHKLAR